MIGRDDNEERGKGLNAPLDDGQAFLMEGDDDDAVEVWYPNWDRAINYPTNVKFIEALVKAVIDGEMVSTQL